MPRTSSLQDAFPLLIDGHNDLPLVIRRATRGDVPAYRLDREHPESDTDIPRLKKGKVAAQFFAAFVPGNAEAPGRATLEQIDIARNIPLSYPADLMLATKSADIARARRTGKIACFVTVESGVGLENSLSPLRIWHAAGVRLLTLCHNETLDWVDSATDAPRNGLTAFGQDVVRECQRLGIIVDLSHVAPSSMHQVLDVAEAPVVWSHSNVFALCDHPRNVPDDVLARVRRNGGIVMATFVPQFLSQAVRDAQRPMEIAAYPLDQKEPPAVKADGNARATLEDLLDHIDGLVARIGIEHVGIGSDFFGGPTPTGLENVSTFPRVIDGLARRGYSPRAIRLIAGANMLRVMRRIEAYAASKADARPIVRLAQTAMRLQSPRSSPGGGRSQ